MASQTDRSSDLFGIANGSQTIAVAATAAAADGRTPYQWSPSTTSSRNVSARARDEVVEETAGIEYLDFTPEIPCNGKGGQCGAPAAYFVEHRCPLCGWHKDGANGTPCKPCWVGRSREVRRCSKCRACYPHGDGWRVVEVFR